MQVQSVSRDVVVKIVIESLQTVLEQADEEIPAGIGEDTVLVGPSAVIDSLGVVSLIVEVEQRLEIDHHVSVTLANDKAMSQRNSPFRTVGVLADYALSLIEES
jgi:acyl carrier protein